MGITDEAGDTRATYGYTAYGSEDEDLFTGVDRPAAGDPTTQEPYNAYRYSSQRWDAHTETYDMGFRDYNPGLNRFLTRDTFNGALADLSLTTSPWNMNRYTYAGANPTSLVELHGHLAVRDIDGSGGGAPNEPEPVTPDQAAHMLFGTPYEDLDQVDGAGDLSGIHPTATAELFALCVNEANQDACSHVERHVEYYNSKPPASPLLAELLGLGDAQRCAGGNAGGCAWLASAFLPIAKLAKLLKIFRAGGRAPDVAATAQRTTAGVWDDIASTQPIIPDTGGLPKSFLLNTGEGSVWVHGNATEHIAEYAGHMTRRGASPEAVSLGTQIQLGSLQNAVAQATRGGIQYDKFISVGGWELKFGRPRGEGFAPALTHARLVG